MGNCATGKKKSKEIKQKNKSSIINNKE